MIGKTLSITAGLVRREFDYCMVKPSHLLLFLTYRCTSRCNTCTMWQRQSSDRELSLEEWKRFIDMAARRGIRNVEMFGGDALLRKDVLIPLTRYIRGKGIPQVDLVTNGNLLDRQTAQDLVDAGITTVYVSVDGVEDLQDAVRGKSGSFDHSRKALEYLVACRAGSKMPKLVVNCTVSSLNIDGFERVFPFACMAGADVVAFEYAGEFPRESIARSSIGGIAPQPYFVSQGTSILLNRQQAILLKKKIRDIKERSRHTDITLITKNIDVLKIEDLMSGRFGNKRCYICRYLITVDPFGNILPCAFFDRYHVGNVKQDDLEDLWNNARHRDFIRHAGGGKTSLCRHCIVGVERNPTLFGSLQKAYFQFTKKGFDEYCS